MKQANDNQLCVDFKCEFSSLDINIQLAIPLQGITVVFGPSGSGKTTLLRFIAGLNKQQTAPSNKLSVGEQIWHSADTNLPAHKRNIGYVFQEPSLFEHMTVEQNIEFGCKYTDAALSQSQLNELIQLLDLHHLLSAFPATLSGGEKQRVAIARVLATGPQMLLMDEPLASLDKSRKQQILHYLEVITQRYAIPVIYVTHSHEEMLRLADYLVLLEQGKVSAHGTLNQLLSKHLPALQQQDEICSLVKAVVSDFDEQHHLSTLNASGTEFRLTHCAGKIGQAVRLLIYAKDISLNLESSEHSSILNCILCQIKTIESIKQSGDCLITLQSNEVELVAKISSYSCEKLQLATGTQVYAQIKAVSIAS